MINLCRSFALVIVIAALSPLLIPRIVAAQLPFEVVPDGAGRTVEPNTTNHSASFSVWNNKQVMTEWPYTSSDTFVLNCDIIAPVSSCDYPSAVTVDRGATADIDVTYGVGAAGSGRVALGATDVYDTDGWDQGYYNITVASSAPPAASVDVWSSATPPLFQPSSSETVGFTIRNTGTVSGTFTLEATCSTFATNCQTNLGSVTLGAGIETSRTVSFTTPGSGRSGGVTLRATNSADATKTGVATVSVFSDGHPPPSSGGPPTADPIITIAPAFKYIIAGNTVNVTIRWCLPSVGSWQSMVVLNEHPDGITYITSAFTTTHNQAPQPANCMGPNDSWAYSTGTVTVREGGPNRIYASAFTSSGAFGQGAAVYELIPPPRGVAVVASGQEAEALPNATGLSARFTVTNTGAATDTFNLSRTCSATASCTSTPPAFVVIGSGQSTDVTVTYSVGSAVGNVGLIGLKARHKRDTSVVDSSWTEVTVVNAPAPGVLLVGSGDVLERDLCLTASAGSGVAVECGDLRAVHPLPSVRTLNKARTPVLLFNTQHADPLPMVSADVTLPAGDALNGSVVATLTINGAMIAQTRNASEWGAPLTRRRITLSVDASTYATGIYSYQLEVRRFDGGSNPVVGVVSGELPVVNRRQSPFGAGWWLAGLEQLVIQGDSIAWVGGDGSTRRYRRVAGTTTWLATTIDRPDSLTSTGDRSSYDRHLPNNLRVRFDATGRHVATINRLGHQTSYIWGTAGGRAVLDSLVVPTLTGRFGYRFAYNAQGWLDSVIAPYSTGTRAARLTTDVTGRVTQIRDPDLETVSFGYDPTIVRRITSRTDRRNFTTTFQYDAGGRMTRHSVTIEGGAVIGQDYRSLETIGLPGTSRGTAQQLDSVYAQIDGPRADVVDISKFWFTRFGTVRRIRNPLGRETTITYGDARFPALASERRDPSWFVARTSYNDRGLGERVIAVNPRGTGQNDTTTYLWHAKWAAPTAITSPMGVSDAITYDWDTGNPLSQQHGDFTTRVVFGYDAATGLPRVVGVPGVQPDTLYYGGSLGNLDSARAPTGAVTRMLADAIGRDTLVVSPIASAHTGWTRTIYDVMDQVRRSVQFGPAMSGAPADSVVVTQTYDDEGNLTRATRNRGGNVVNQGDLISSFTYDGAGRKLTEDHPGSTVQFVYDSAGNLRQHQTNNGTTAMRYDAGGRLIERVIPERTYPASGCAFTDQVLCMFSFPTRGDSVCLSADTARFGYDAAGRIKRADNIHARVRRSYTPGGLVSAETQRVRGYYSRGSSPCEAVPEGQYASEFTTHVYTLAYAYNRDGQRDSLVHPGGTQRYEYSADRGFLVGVTDVGGRTYGIDYDAAGRVAAVQYPGGVTDIRTHDALGRLAVRAVTGVILDSLTYDWQGRMLRASQNGRPAATAQYNGLGAVVQSLDYGSASGWTETFAVDALGNRVRSEHPGLRPLDHPDFRGVRVSQIDWAGRLETVADSFVANNAPFIHAQTHWYDPAGNTALTFQHEWASHENGGHTYNSGKSYYGSDGRLRAFNRHLGIGAVSDDTRPGQKGAFEEYRYDALGRRVLVRSRRDLGCNAFTMGYQCAAYIERVVWDGDQVLLEYRADGADSVSALALEEATSAGDAFGAVMYTHGLGLDQPLSVIKGGVAVMPHANWRGLYAVGTLETGVCGGGGQPICPNLDWPGANVTLDGARVTYPVVATWWGNLITGKVDGSGLKYMRNRYYDPQTGRFTQEDPIGLAGGLNLYGYAGGDPVNFSDPFGLCPYQDDKNGRRDYNVETCPQGKLKDAFRRLARSKAPEGLATIKLVADRRLRVTEHKGPINCNGTITRGCSSGTSIGVDTHNRGATAVATTIVHEATHPGFNLNAGQEEALAWHRALNFYEGMPASYRVSDWYNSASLARKQDVVGFTNFVCTGSRTISCY